MNGPLLRVADLHSGYAGGRVLHGVSLCVNAAEVVALMGRNGVGKSTFMRTLIGIVKVDKGSIYINERDVTRSAPYTRARWGLGYVPQGREIFGGLTVGENLKIGTLAAVGRAGQSAEMSEKVLSYFPILRERLAQKAGTMSGGEQQQLAIARALVGAPKVLLLDEPSEGVQPSIVQAIADTLVKIAKELQVAVILVEQDIAMIERVADRCFVMDKGSLTDELTRAQLRDEALMRRYLAL
jgi:branched-chain amino acid transport system ATP-binding protein